ncbi:MAG: NAD-dependent epimerase/dehydratase family protein [Desulfuromusa sp.]|nr:NAD-dependent epimerase/dehydratase family protein [Desulfuromusa sp.]
MKAFNGKKILLTGGTGYLASGVVSLLLKCDCQIVRMTRQGPFGDFPKGINEVIDLIADIRDPEIWESCLEGIDMIFHFAAQTSTYIANADPVADHEVNVRPMLRMLEACRSLKTKPKVCFASTVTVAGIPQTLPVGETHPDHPVTIYDLHKQMAEEYLRWYTEQGWVCGVSLRLTNIYGPGPRSSREDRGVLNQMIRRAVNTEPLTVYGTGEQLRDYLFIEDAAQACLVAAGHAEILSGEYYVIGSGVGHSISETMEIVAAKAEALTGNPVVIEHIEPPDSLSAIEQRNFVADSRKFSQLTGWKPDYQLEAGIARTMDELL